MTAPQPGEESLFDAARRIADPDRRAAYLRQACRGDAALRGRVERLLRAVEQDPKFLEAPAAELSAAADAPGRTIGPFKLLQLIGEGGMGRVYMAEQEHPVRRKLALKVIKAGMDTRQVVARFEAERQALALMDHPSIAKVLDGGTTPDGRPFFVMELVKGVPITKFCDGNRLTVRDRLVLFADVCHAVQHAHMKGVIHRDLKPSNVLVAPYDGKPVPKVIDFGVAKAAGQPLTDKTLFTEFGAVVGTPEYMSPEQAELNNLDIDTRSDVYSLGVLLYELLTGTTPLTRERLSGTPLVEVLRLIREEEPPRPSTRLGTTQELPAIAAMRGADPKRLAGLVRGELDWIVMRALEKDRNRRYETAAALAADVGRYLADEPVLACPPSVAYRVRKFARRNHRALLTAAVVGVALLLAAGTLGWAIRDAASRRAKLADDARGSMRHELDWAERLLREGKRLEAVATWERAARLEPEAAPDGPLRERLADLKRQLDDAARDEEFVTGFENIRLREATNVRVEPGRSGFDHPAAVRKIRDLLGRYGFEVGVTPPADVAARLAPRPEAVRAQLVAALHAGADRAEGLPGARDWAKAVLDGAERDPWRVQVLRTIPRGDLRELERLAHTADLRDQPAEFLVRVAKELSRRSPEAGLAFFFRVRERYPGDFWANTELGRVLVHQGRAAEAVRYFTAALALRPDNPGALVNRGHALYHAREWAAAAADFQTAADLAPGYTAAHRNLGFTLERLQEWKRAATALRRVTELQADDGDAHAALGHALLECGDREGALAASNRAIALKLPSASGRAVGHALLANHDGWGALATLPLAVDPDQSLAEAYWATGRVRKDSGDLPGAIAAYRQAVAWDARNPAIYHDLGVALGAGGDRDRAVAALTNAVALNPKSTRSLNSLGNALMAKKDFAAAEAAFRRAVAADPDYAPAHDGLGRALLARGDVPGGMAEHRRAIALDPTEPVFRYNLGNALADNKEFDEAEAVYRDALARNPKYAEAHYNLGLVLVAKKDVPAAMAAFRTAIAIDPKHAKAHNNLGALLARTNNLPAAIASFRTAIALDPEDAQAHLNLGEALANQGKWDDATTAVREAVRLNPDRPFAFALLGDLLRIRGESAEAVAAYKQAVARQPGHQHSHAMLAALLTTCPDPRHRDAKRAAEAARKLIELGDEYNGRTFLGWAEYQAGDYKASVASLEKAMTVSRPKPGGGAGQWLVLAMAHWRLGNKDEARRWYDRAARSLDGQKNPPDHLARFRAEATELLGADPAPKK
jgi:tetratricopeptide (TPR) repeat protein/serine/threonine protein kinase